MLPTTVAGLWMDRHPVTNAEFAAFVAATGYVTVAERPLRPEDYPGALPELLVPGGLVFQPTGGPVDLGDYTNWWAYVPAPAGAPPAVSVSSLDGLGDHPVVQVAYEDAEAFATWAGKRCRPRPSGSTPPAAGSTVPPSAGARSPPAGPAVGQHVAGGVPVAEPLLDGYEGTSPVGTFPPNPFGLVDMAGNVWEWTSDWWQPNRHAARAGGCCAPSRPQGDQASSLDPLAPQEQFGRRVIKGGSHLCAPNYCLRFRPAARQPESVDTSTCHIGFRCVRHDLPAPA